MSTLLGLLHGLDYLFLCLLIGSALFSKVILPAGGEGASDVLNPWGRRFGIYLALLGITSVLWLICMSAEMSESWEVENLTSAIIHTHFGHLWFVRLFLLLLIGLTFKFNKFGALLILALFLPIFSSLTGHAAARPAAFVLSVGLDYFHFLAAAIWTGGLVSLWMWMKNRLRMGKIQIPPETSFAIVKRFSHFAMASTAVIAATGLLMAYRYGVAPLSPWGSNYGVLILVKTTIFSLALLAASVNQFLHLGKWHPDREASFAKGIFREVSLEIALVSCVLLVAGFLTRTSTPADQAMEQTVGER